MEKEVKENAIYTAREAQGLLKISSSTIKRLLKRGLIRANKVGGQYRILGKEILRLVSPELEARAGQKYMALKRKIVKTINPW